MTDFTLALAFVLLAALLKYAIGRLSTGNNFFLTAMELPVDLLFACIAFLATYIVMITNMQMEKAIEVAKTVPDHSDIVKALTLPFFQTTAGGVLLFVIYIFVTTIVIICWRKSEEYFNATGINTKSILITGLGYLLTLTSIMLIISLIKAVR